MSDDVQILGGGAVVVDTETLRRTAALFAAAQVELDGLLRRIGSVQLTLFHELGASGDAQGAVYNLWARMGQAIAEATEIGERLTAAAAIYELVELNARHRAALFSGDAAELSRIDRLRDAITAEYPGVMEHARGLEFERIVMWPGELTRQATELGFTTGEHLGERAAIIGGVTLGLSTLGLASIAGLSGQGLVARDARLSGSAPAVALTRVVPATTAAATTAPVTSAPATLAAAAARIPNDGAARVRVERYAMRDGTRQFVVYVPGTQSMAVSGKDPWDNRSNAELYAGTKSASYVATERALAEAGARPGDIVHAIGHSQGGMIASHLALEGGYDTRTLIAIGSPVEADVGRETLSIGIRHTDDPAAALAGGGHLGSVGAPGSFVAERVADPAVGAHDIGLPSHGLRAYIETAAIVDASGDPRVAAVHDVLAQLGEAESIDVVEFAATRVSPSAAAAG